MSDIKLWRYFDLLKFFAFLDGRIYFVRADKFKDKYEGAIPKTCFESFVEQSSYRNDEKEKQLVRDAYLKKFDERKKKAAISCWHINEKESAPMWDMYTNAGQGIAICTSMDKLKSIPKPNEYELEGFEVNYIDFDSEFKEEYFYNELLTFTTKRIEFKHEHEYRMLLFKVNNNSAPFKGFKTDFMNSSKNHKIVEGGFVSNVYDMPEEGVSIKIDPSAIIDEIVMSPYMKSYEIESVQKIIELYNKKNGTEFKVRESNLYSNLMY